MSFAATLPEFRPFPKIARLNREVVITEKIDGTNAQVFIDETGTQILAGSRTRWITPQDDNYGFARWVEEHRDELFTLGPGQHFGEWWGSGIQRGYGLAKGEKRFSLFNVSRWCLHGKIPAILGSADPTKPGKLQDILPACVGLVPVLFRGSGGQLNEAVDACLEHLRAYGSAASHGFMKPEGIVVFHTASGDLFKVTLEKDEVPKTLAARS